MVDIRFIYDYVGDKGKIYDRKKIDIDHYMPFHNATKGSMTFTKSLDDMKQIGLDKKLNPSLIIAPIGVPLYFLKQIKCSVICVHNPRLWFIKIINKFFDNKEVVMGVHPDAIVTDPNIQNRNDIAIGAYSNIGYNVKIGENTVISNNVTIKDNVTIGKNVWIEPGAVIGTDGFGFEWDEDGEVVKFPHRGGVKIGDDVEIGANTCVDCGTMDDTVIGRNTKIDNLVHIAHNVKIGKNCFIIANSLLAGSSVIGDNVRIAMSATIREKVKVGKKAVVGMGAIVTKDVPAGKTVYGNPAKIQ